jgi:hypothetical protein
MAGSNSTERDRKPFGENVEGLSFFGNESYAVELPVQTDNFQQLTFFGNRPLKTARLVTLLGGEPVLVWR